jgi:hypothetical protein
LQWNFADGPYLVSSITTGPSIIVVKLGSTASPPTAIRVSESCAILGVIKAGLSDYKSCLLVTDVGDSSISNKPSEKELLRMLGHQGIFNRSFLDSASSSSLASKIITDSTHQSSSLRMRNLDEQHAAAGATIPVPLGVPNLLWQGATMMKTIEIPEFVDGNISCQMMWVSVTADGKLIRFFRGKLDAAAVSLENPTSMCV